MGERVRITDVSPRDGLQNEAGIIPTAEKVELVRLLCQTGVDEVEVTSFVSPKWVPQLGDAGEVLREACQFRPDSFPYSVLVPNEQGMQMLLKANEESVAACGRPVISQVCLLTAASEKFCKRNLNSTIKESFDRMEPVLRLAMRHGIAVKFYVSCCFACPFEGPISPDQAIDVLYFIGQKLDHSDMWDRGDHFENELIPRIEVSISDTIGAATPESVRAFMDRLHKRDRQHYLYVGNDLSLHLHDTFGRAAECVKAALDLGIRSFDGSVAGLGGCPYASTPGKRAPGNIATHTLVKTIHDAGFTTGVDLAKLDEAAAFATKIVAASRARAAAAGGQP